MNAETENLKPEDDDEAVDPHSEDELLKQVKRHKKESDQHIGVWRDDAKECYAFVAGDQWAEEDRIQLVEMLRAPVVFNRIGPMVEAVAGSEVNNRQQVQYIPRQAGDSGVNEVLTGAADYFREACDAEDEESDAFMDLVICGVGVTETFLDYIDNAEGMVITDRRDPLSMRWDSAAKKRNLSDRKWDQREEWQDITEIKTKWPDKAEEVGAGGSGWSGYDNNDGKPHDATFDFLYLKDNTGQDPKTGKLRVIHEQWFELETYYLILDPMTQQTAEMDKDTLDRLKPRLKKLGIDLQSVKKQRKKFYQVFTCGDIVLEFSEVACNEFARKFITGRRDRNNNTWYGLVRAMIDPQRWANKFFSQFLHTINTNAKGGLIIEKGATDNLRSFKNSWAKADGITVVEDGAISRKKIQPKPVPNIPPQMSQMMEFAISSLRDVSGLNLEILGMADRQQAGVLEAQRKQSALVILATLFDALRRYRKEQGRLLAKFITEYLSDGRLVRIAGGNGQERYIPLLKQTGALEYDVIVDESAATVNQKDKTFAVLMQLLPTLKDQGIPFGPELLEYMPLPAAMTSKWGEQIKQQKAEAQQNPGPPPPQVVSAQASMVKAQASMLSAQAGAQKDQQEAQFQPIEVQLRDRELQLQAQDQDIRKIEAQTAFLTAQADLMRADKERLGLQNPETSGIG